MSAKLNERLFRLAARVRDERSYESRYAIADAIESIAREVAQPIADERDEALNALRMLARAPHDDLAISVAEAILSKYKQP